MRIDASHLNRPERSGHARENGARPPDNLRFKRARRFPVFGILALIVFAAAVFVGIPRYLRKDYGVEIVSELRIIREAQEIYRQKISKYQSYGNFEDLVNAGLLPASSVTFTECQNCDERNLWTSARLQRRFQFEIQRDVTATNYCIKAVSSSKGERAFALTPNGAVLEDDADKISCVTSPPTKINIETGK